MPSVTIERRRRDTPSEAAALIDAVHQSLRDAFRIPNGERVIRIFAHDPNYFAAPPALTKPEEFTYITIDAFAGRSTGAKQELYACIGERLSALGIPKDHVKVLLREQPTENFAVVNGRGEIDLGFALGV